MTLRMYADRKGWPLERVTVRLRQSRSHAKDCVDCATKHVGLNQIEREVVGCRACPRLVAWREQVGRDKRRAYMDWDYWARPVPGFGDPEAGILVGNGSNELIQAVLAVTVREGVRVVIPEPTFTLYRLMTEVGGGEVVSVPLDAPEDAEVIARADAGRVTRGGTYTVGSPAGGVAAAAAGPLGRLHLIASPPGRRRGSASIAAGSAS